MKRLLALLIGTALLLGGCSYIPTVGTLPSIGTEASVSEQPNTTPPQTTVLPTTQIPTFATTVTTPPAATQSSESYALAESLPLEERVGQLFLARCPDINAAADAAKYHLGGYVLFGRDFQFGTPQSTAETITAYQSAAAIPMLIAVDEEGGTVTRVSSYPQYRGSRFPSPRTLYNSGGLALIAQTEAEKCQLLRSLGINVNLAPVCDITTDPNSFMYKRSLGQSAEETGNFIRTVLKVMEENGIGGVLKHFPGYGNNVDTHLGIGLDDRPLEYLEQADLLPFAAGIDAGCGAVLVSHVFVNCLDNAMPASLSPAVHGYLREQMGFDGVVITDDLVMQGITELYGAEESAILAVLAGNDLLCSSEYALQYNAVLNAVRSGRIPEETVTQAAARVLKWKQELGLLPPGGEG